MSRIPEVIDLDEQAEKLKTTFGGNLDFKAIRGRCSGELLSVTDAVMHADDGTPKAPSHGVDDLKRFLTSFANIRGKIAQLERDGFTLAVHEAREALEHPGYRMLGETEPLEETIPVTLLIFEPELTLWLLTQESGVYFTRTWLNTAAVPSTIWERLFEKSLDLKYYDKVSASDIYKTLWGINEPLRNKLSAARKGRFDCENGTSMAISVTLPDPQGEKDSKIGLGYFALALYKKRNAIMRCFTHEERKRIAAWQFHLPKAYAGKEEHHLYFGLHLVAEHEYWLRKRNPFCSSNIVNGYGAIAYPGEAYHCFDKKSERFKGTRILLCN